MEAGLRIRVINDLAMGILETAFRPLYHKPCWGAQQGYGSFLTFEFGNPHLRIREPIKSHESESTIVRQMHSRRLVRVRGDWHLWIYCCDWTISLDGRALAKSSSTKAKIAKATAHLNGQALTKVFVDTKRGRSRFEFDLGGVLETTRFDRSSIDQWLLYEPSGMVLVVRADGQYSHHKADLPQSRERWRPLGDDRHQTENRRVGRNPK